MNKISPAGEFVEDPGASGGSACPPISLLGQVTEDGRIADNFTLIATRIHTDSRSRLRRTWHHLFNPETRDDVRGLQDPADEGRYQNSVDKIISFKGRAKVINYFFNACLTSNLSSVEKICK
jgi:hypothetical protein